METGGAGARRSRNWKLTTDYTDFTDRAGRSGARGAEPGLRAHRQPTLWARRNGGAHHPCAAEKDTHARMVHASSV